MSVSLPSFSSSWPACSCAWWTAIEPAAYFSDADCIASGTSCSACFPSLSCLYSSWALAFSYVSLDINLKRKQNYKDFRPAGNMYRILNKLAQLTCLKIFLHLKIMDRQ